MSITYFDVTDLVQYAKGHNRVSGIQRVQWRILSELAHGEDAEQVHLCFHSSERGQHLSIPARAVFTHRRAEFHGGRFLRTLGEIDGGLMPPRYEVKRLLKPYEDRKWLRGLLKGQLYLTALLQPERLLARGVEEWRDSKTPQMTPTQAHTLSLNPQDKLVLLGAYWDQPTVIQLAQGHRRAQGDVVMLVHDVIPDAAPALCTDGQVRLFRQRMHIFPQVANRFMAVSHYTARDFVKAMLGAVRLEDVQVVPLAHEFGDLPRRTVVDLTEVRDVPCGQQQVLCVGTIEARKNQVLLLQVWQMLIDRFGEQTPELVLCGKYGSKTEAFKRLLAKDPALQAKVRILPAPTDAELARCYEQAWFTVFPSLYEGWGLPVGEAAWLGKVCLASNASSVPEVLGQAAPCLPPDEPEAWSDFIGLLITTPHLLGLWTQQVLQAPLRDWTQVAADMHAAILAAPVRKPQQTEAARPDIDRATQAWPAQAIAA